MNRVARGVDRCGGSTGRLSGRALATLAVWSVICSASVVARGDELELLEGDKLVASIVQVRADGGVSGTGVPEKLTLDGLRRYARTLKKAMPVVGAGAELSATVDLVGGGRILARAVTLADERVTVESVGNKPWSAPIDLVRGVRFDVGTPSPTYVRALERPSAEVDRFLVLGEEPGAVESLDALIDSLTTESVQLELKGERRELPRERLYGFVLARPENEKATPPRGWLTLVNSSRVPFERLTLEAGVVRIVGPASGEWEVPWESVAGFEVRSERVEYLSDRKPTRVDEKSLAAPARMWRADASVTGRRMRLGDRSFDKGVGVQARSKLTYALDGKFEKFFVEVGIDSETDGEGDCEVSVTADDGRVLWNSRVKGDEPARTVKLDVRGVKSLTLVVEPGEDLDLSDHVDWADARLLRAGK